MTGSRLFAFILITASLLQSGCSPAVFKAQRTKYDAQPGAGENLNRAHAIAQKLFDIQNKANFLWQRSGWWNNANILEAMIDLNRITGQNYTRCLLLTYKKNLRCFSGNYITHHAFDDNEWWALTWLKAYDLTGDNRYLRCAKGIFNDMLKRSWDSICGGGMRWAANGEYKNAITNELFMELAVRLALEPADSAQKRYYLEWALKDWAWLKNSGMINNANLINDGLNDNCVNNKGTTWTYNQGVILGALKDIYLATGDTAFLLQAKKLAYASMKGLVNTQAVLTEPGGRVGNGDHNQFKGVYIRYLAQLNTVLKDANIKIFIQSNADYAWQHARSGDFIDYNWSGPFTRWNGSTQGSALDLMNAALMQE